jgi:hypothetical protein
MEAIAESIVVLGSIALSLILARLAFGALFLTVAPARARSAATPPRT